MLVKIRLVLDDSGDRQRQPALTRDFDGQVYAFVRMDAAQKNQIVAAV